MPQRKTPQRQSSRLWLGLLAFVVVAGIIAVVASRGSNDDATSVGSTDDGTTGSTALALQQTRPVTVTGSPLPRLAQPDAAMGTVIPTVEGRSFDGTPVSIKADGRAKVVIFVAHWCPHCQREVPRLSEYLQDDPLPADIDLITVATGTTADRPNYPPSEWLERENWPGPVLADGEDQKAASAFGLSAYPFFVAIDKDGKVVARTSGELTTEQFAQLVQLARRSPQ